MCSIDAVTRVPDQCHDTADVHPAAVSFLDESFHGAVLRECRDDVPLARVHIGVADGQDVLIRKVPERFRLEPFGSWSEVRQQLKDGDIVLVGVMNEVDVATAAFSQLLLDGVAVADHGAGA